MPIGVVTVTSTIPAAGAAGTVTMSRVSVTAQKSAAVAPKLTPVTPVKPLPVTVTAHPPATGPQRGLTPHTSGSPVPWAGVGVGVGGGVQVGVSGAVAVAVGVSGAVAVAVGVSGGVAVAVGVSGGVGVGVEVSGGVAVGVGVMGGIGVA